MRLIPSLLVVAWCLVAPGLLRADAPPTPSTSAASAAPDPIGAPITIDVPILVAGYGSAFFEQVAREFEALHPGVSVHLYGNPRIDDQVRIRVMAGEYPDATDAVLLYPKLIRTGHILNLAPYLDGPDWENDARWRDTFLPDVLDRWTISDSASDSATTNPKSEISTPKSIYGLPFAHAVWTIFYNKKQFRENGWSVPRTWPEFFALCDRMKARGIAPLSLPGTAMRYGDAFLRAAHYNLVGPDGYRAYNALAPGARTDPRFIRAAAILQRVSTEDLIKGWQGMAHTDAELAFINGQAAMTVSASWFVNEMRGKLPAGFELGAMNFPVFSDGITPSDTLQTQSAYYFLFNNGNPARERAAVDFFRYLTSRTVARRFAQTIDSPVALRAVKASDYSAAMQDTAGLIAHASGSFDAAPPASAENLAFINQAMTDARYRLMTGRITPQEFGERLEAAAAAERARRADPNRVEANHDVAAFVLLLTLAGLVAWLAWPRGRKIEVGRDRWARREFLRRAHLQPDGPAVRPYLFRKGRRRSASAVSEDLGRAGPLGPPRISSACASPTGRPSGPSLPPAQAPEYFGRLRGGLALGFVGPALVLFGALVVLPGLVSFAWAFTRWDGLGPQTWAGWFNFKWLLLESDVFWFALKNNLFLMLVPPLFVVPAALFFATLIHRGVWGAGFFRVAFLFPNILGGIAATLLWMSAYAPNGGLINTLLVKLGLSDFAGFAWLSQAHLYWSLIPIYLWMACGFNLVLYLAAMQGIPADYYEAAELEGASKARQFFTITLPLIREVLVVSAVFLVIGGLNAFEMIWLLTSQNPASGSHTLSTLMVSTMFQEFQIGRATAIAVMMFVLVLIGSASVMRALKRESVEL